MGLVRLNGKSGCFPCSLLHSICSLTLTGGLKVTSMCPEVSALPNRISDDKIFVNTYSDTIWL